MLFFVGVAPTSHNIGFPLHQRPATLRDITFGMSFALEEVRGCCGKSHANPNGTITSEILRTLYEIH